MTKLYGIVIRLFLGFLLVKAGMGAELWVFTFLGLLIGLSASPEFFERFTRAVNAMKG